MRAVVTRVKSASVTIGGETAGSIGKGFLVLLGVTPRPRPTRSPTRSAACAFLKTRRAR